MKKKIRVRYERIVLIFLIPLIVVIGLLLIINKKSLMIDFTNKDITEVENYVKKNALELEKIEEYSDMVLEGQVISQNIEVGASFKKGDRLVVTISLGKLTKENYTEANINELGRIPVMMYHGIQNITDNETSYIGGNIDKDGYQRTAESFRRDLDFYYNSGYRMIRLDDYVNGIIKTGFGKSPIVLTFDDGLSNNIKVISLDENGNIIIDPNSAVGILEEYKKKYPDFNVTATFFVNGGLFNQADYNEKIIEWLVNNGYDVGNHGFGHADLSKTTTEQTSREIGRIYNILEQIIPNKYVKIVALPFGSPYGTNSDNFPYIIDSEYEGTKYHTISTLRVGWESDYSPFSKNFNQNFIKRIRAYDNNGEEFDIKANFKSLEKSRYISDGNEKTIVISEANKSYLKDNLNLEVITY